MCTRKTQDLDGFFFFKSGLKLLNSFAFLQTIVMSITFQYHQKSAWLRNVFFKTEIVYKFFMITYKL